MTANKNQHTVLAFGEVLWDVYPDGAKLGGAPFNVIAHLTQLGVHGYMVSRIGTDEFGRKILRKMDELDCPADLIQQDPQYPTGQVLVQLDEQGKPTYDILAPAAWDFITFDAQVGAYLENADLLVFGTLAARQKVSRSTLERMIKADVKKVCDINLRQSHYNKDLIEQLLDHTHILKINDEELDVLSEMFQVRQDDIVRYLMDRFHLEGLVVTLGKKGAEAYDRTTKYYQSGIQVDVVDTVGSGDAFLAGFVRTYLDGQPLARCLEVGCKLGAHVATHRGAIPQINPDDFLILGESD